MFESVVAVVFQSVFRVEKNQNNIFLFFKIFFIKHDAVLLLIPIYFCVLKLLPTLFKFTLKIMKIKSILFKFTFVNTSKSYYQTTH